MGHDKSKITPLKLHLSGLSKKLEYLAFSEPEKELSMEIRFERGRRNRYSQLLARRIQN